MVNKILKVGDSAAVTIPKKTLHDMGIKIGDNVYVTYLARRKELTIRSAKKEKKIVSERIAKLTVNFIDRYRPALDKLSE